ncbi:protein SNORC isoform X2 [Erpetoichthys calabaricus]|uniref:protein SNORC isoform X2 n=1 Tax=Erpetoichthys calabaricus TaxID=27687 RepID=UPI0022345986|nr:protein SNORC isoform X2 [Erpetoichthys calabaricus]
MAVRSSQKLSLVYALLFLWMATVQTAAPADPIPTPENVNIETSSGGGSIDVTTKGASHGLTEYPITTEYEYEDITYSQPVDREDGSLGPGAIAAIVLAVILGTSVLIALVIITLKKFTTS